MHSATITDITLARDGVVLVHADCDRCQRTVLHGAGDDPDALVLGHRVGHGLCTEYTLTDPHGIVSARTGVLRAELAAQAPAGLVGSLADDLPRDRPVCLADHFY